jgi:putative phosphoesterase
MRIGILSDSHDNRAMAEKALALFLREGAVSVLHLGDVCSPAALEPFRASGLTILGVFGNNDGDRDGLQAVSAGGFRKGPRILSLDGREVLMAHSFDELHPEIGAGGKFDLILFGHTHRALTMRVGRAVVINPGEACGFASGRPTCAVVDLSSMTASILDLPPDAGGSP